MRAPIASGLTGFGFALGGYAMPIAFPDADPAIGQTLLVVAAVLIALGAILAAWPHLLRKQKSDLGEQTTSPIPDGLPARLLSLASEINRRLANFPDWGDKSEIVNRLASQILAAMAALEQLDVRPLNDPLRRWPKEIMNYLNVVGAHLELGNLEGARKAAEDYR